LQGALGLDAASIGGGRVGVLHGTMSYVVGAEGGYHVMKIIIARDYIGDEAVPYRGTQAGH